MADPKFIDRVDSEGKVLRFREDQGWTPARVDASMKARFGYRGTPNKPMFLPLPEGRGKEGMGFPAGWPEYAAHNSRHEQYGVGRRFKDQQEFEALQQAARVARPAEMSWQQEEEADILAYQAMASGHFNEPSGDGGTIADKVYGLRNRAQQSRNKSFDDFAELAALHPGQFDAMVRGLFGKKFDDDEGGLLVEDALLEIQKRQAAPMAWSLRSAEGFTRKNGEKTGLLSQGLRPMFVPMTPLVAGGGGHVYGPSRDVTPKGPEMPATTGPKEWLTPMRIGGWQGAGESGQKYNIPAAPWWMTDMVNKDPNKAQALLRQHFMTNIPHEYQAGLNKSKYVDRVVPLLVQHAIKLGRLEGSGFTGHQKRPREANEYFRPKYTPDLSGWDNKRAYREAVEIGLEAIKATDKGLLEMFGDPDAEDTFWKARDFFTDTVIGYVNSGRLSKSAIRYPATLFRALADTPDAALLMAGVMPNEAAKLTDFYRRISDAHGARAMAYQGDDDPEKIEETQLVAQALAEGALSWDQYLRYQKGDAADVYEVLNWIGSRKSPEAIASIRDIHGERPQLVSSSAPVVSPASGLSGLARSSAPQATALLQQAQHAGRVSPHLALSPPSAAAMTPGQTARLLQSPQGLRGTLPVALGMYGAEQALSPLERESKRQEAAEMNPAELAQLRDENYWAPSLGIASTALAETWGAFRGVSRAFGEEMHDLGLVPHSWLLDARSRHNRLRRQTTDDINERWQRIMAGRLTSPAHVGVPVGADPSQIAEGGEETPWGEEVLGTPLAFTKNLATDGFDTFKGLYTILGQISQISPSDKIALYEAIATEERMKAGGDVRALQQDERFAAHVKARGEDWAELLTGIGVFLDDIASVEDANGNFEVGAGKLFAARPLSTALTFLDGARLIYHSPLGKAMGKMKHQALGNEIRKMDSVVVKALFAPAWVSNKIYGRAVRYFGDKSKVSKELAINWLADNGLKNAVAEQRVTIRDIKRVAQSLTKGDFEKTFSMLTDEAKVVMLPYVSHVLAKADGVSVPKPMELAQQLDSLLPEGVLGEGVTVTGAVADAMIAKEMRREARRQSQGATGDQLTLSDLFEQHTDRGTRDRATDMHPDQEKNPGVWANEMNSPMHVVNGAVNALREGQINANPVVLHIESPQVYAKALSDTAEYILSHETVPSVRSEMVKNLTNMADEAAGYVPLSKKAQIGMSLYETEKRKAGAPALENWGAESSKAPTWVHPEVVKHLETYVDMHKAIVDQLIKEGVVKVETLATDLAKDSVRLRIGGMIDTFHRTHQWKMRPELPTKVNKVISDMMRNARPRRVMGETTGPRPFIEHTLADWIAAGWWEKPEVLADIIRMQPEVLDMPTMARRVERGAPADIKGQPWQMTKDDFVRERTNWDTGAKDRAAFSRKPVDEDYLMYSGEHVSVGKSIRHHSGAGQPELWRPIGDDLVLVKNPEPTSVKQAGEIYILRNARKSPTGYGGEVVGTIKITHDGKPNLAHFVISPEYRGKGYGQVLLDAAEEFGLNTSVAELTTKHASAAIHRHAVRSAIRAGETVPAAVMRDYPDLVPGSVEEISAPGALTDATLPPVQRIAEAADIDLPTRFYPPEPTRVLETVLSEAEAKAIGATKLTPDELARLGPLPLKEYILGRATREAPSAVRKLYKGRNQVTNGLFLPETYKGSPMTRDRWKSLSPEEQVAISAPLHATELRRFIKMAEDGNAATWSPSPGVIHYPNKASKATLPIVPGAGEMTAYKLAFPGKVNVPGWELLPPIPAKQAAGVVQTAKAIADVSPESLASPAKQMDDSAAISDTIPTRPEYLESAYHIDNTALQLRVDSVLELYNKLGEDGRIAASEALTGLSSRVQKARQIRGGRQKLINSAQGWDHDAGMTVAEKKVLDVIEGGNKPNTLPAWLSMPVDEFRRRVHAMDVSSELKSHVDLRLNEYASVSGEVGAGYTAKDAAKAKRNARGFRDWFGLKEDRNIFGTDMKVEAFSERGMETFADETQFLAAVAGQKSFLYQLGASFKSARSARQISTLINNTLNNFVMQMIVEGDFMSPITVWRDNTLYKEYLANPKSIPAQHRAAMKATDDTGAVNTSFVEAEIGIYDKALLEHFGDWSYDKLVKKQLGKVAPGLVNKLTAASAKTISTASKYLFSLPGDMIKKVYASSDNIFKTSDIYRATLEAQNYFQKMVPGDEMRFRQSEMRWATVRRLDGNLWEIDGVRKEINPGQVMLDHNLNLVAAKEGALRTNRKFFDYSDLSPHQMFMRKTQLDLLVSPFYSWTYKSMWVPGLKRGWAREILGGGKEITTNSNAIRNMLGTRDVKRIIQRQLQQQTLRQAGSQSQDQTELLNRMLSFRVDEGMPAVLRWMAPNVMSVDSLFGMDPFRPQSAVIGLAERGVQKVIDYATGPNPERLSPLIIGKEDAGIDKIQGRLNGMRITLSKYTEDEREAMFGKKYRTAESVSFKKLMRAGVIKTPTAERIVELRRDVRDTFPGQVSPWVDALIALGGEKGMVLDVATEIGKLLDTGKWKQINPPLDVHTLVNKIVPYVVGGGTTHAALDLIVGEIDPESPWSSKRYTTPATGEPGESSEKRASRLLFGVGGYYRSLGLDNNGRLKRLSNGKLWKGGWLYGRLNKLKKEWKNASDVLSWATKENDRKKDTSITRQMLIDMTVKRAIVDQESSLLMGALESELVKFKQRLRADAIKRGVNIPESFDAIKPTSTPKRKLPSRSGLGLKDVSQYPAEYAP